MLLKKSLDTKQVECAILYIQWICCFSDHTGEYNNLYILCLFVSMLCKHADKIQHEFFLLFSVMDENESWYLEENIKKFGSDNSVKENIEFQESNKMHGKHICVCVSLITHLCTFTSSLWEYTSLFPGSIIIKNVCVCSQR